MSEHFDEFLSALGYSFGFDEDGQKVYFNAEEGGRLSGESLDNYKQSWDAIAAQQAQQAPAPAPALETAPAPAPALETAPAQQSWAEAVAARDAQYWRAISALNDRGITSGVDEETGATAYYSEGDDGQRRIRGEALEGITEFIPEDTNRFVGDRYYMSDWDLGQFNNPSALYSRFGDTSNMLKTDENGDKYIDAAVRAGWQQLYSEMNPNSSFMQDFAPLLVMALPFAVSAGLAGLGGAAAGGAGGAGALSVAEFATLVDLVGPAAAEAAAASAAGATASGLSAIGAGLTEGAVASSYNYAMTSAMQSLVDSGVPWELAKNLPSLPNAVVKAVISEATGGNPITSLIFSGLDIVGSGFKSEIFSSITSNFPDIPAPVANVLSNAAIAAGKAGLTGKDWETAVTNILTSSAIGGAIGATTIDQYIPPALIKTIVPIIGTAITGGDVTKAIIKAGIQNVGSLFKDSAEQDFNKLDAKLQRGETLTPAENDRLYNFYSNFNKPPDSDQPKVITNLDNEPITKSAEIIAQEEAGTRAIQDNTILAAGLSDTQTDAPPVYSIADFPPYVGIARSDSSPTGFVYLGEDGETTIVNEDGSPYEEPAKEEPQYIPSEEESFTPEVPKSNLPTDTSIIVPDSNLPTSPSGDASPDMSGVTFVGVDGSGNGIYTDGSNNYDSSGNVITNVPNVESFVMPDAEPDGNVITDVPNVEASVDPDAEPDNWDKQGVPEPDAKPDAEPDNWDKQGVPIDVKLTVGNLPTKKFVPSKSIVSDEPIFSGTLPFASSEDKTNYPSPVKPYLQPNWLSTGAPSQSTMYAGLDPKLVNILSQRSAHGGQIHPRLQQVLSNRGFEINPVEMVAGPEDRYYARHAKRGFAVNGEGTGQSDDIPTMLADGEYVFDADTVAALGDGSSKAGAAALDKMREEIRRHKRSAPVNKIPPKAKSPLDYVKMIKRAKS